MKTKTFIKAIFFILFILGGTWGLTFFIPWVLNVADYQFPVAITVMSFIGAVITLAFYLFVGEGGNDVP